MSSAYAPRTIFRQTSNAVLARYFASKDLLSDIDFDSLLETDVEPIFEAYQALPDSVRTGIDTDLRSVNALASERGELILIEEASQFHGLDLQEDFAALDNFHDRAMVSFLDHRDVFDVASLFNNADLGQKRYWILSRAVVKLVPRDDPRTVERLGTALGAYLFKTEGRGQPCTVEVYRRGERHYFFAYPEDYGTTQQEYVGSALDRRAVRPVFEIIFVYSKDEGVFDVYFEGSRKRVPDLRRIFAREVLGIERDPVMEDERVFDLNRLKRPGFPFVFRTDSGIIDVCIRRLRFSAIGGIRERCTLECDPTARPDALYDQVDRTFITDNQPRPDHGNKLPLSLFNISQASLTVQFVRKKGTRGRPTRTFALSYPNACPLGHEGQDAVLRQMLIDSGIERRPAVDTAA